MFLVVQTQIIEMFGIMESGGEGTVSLPFKPQANETNASYDS